MVDNYIEIKCIEVVQPIGLFYVGVIDSEELIRIAYADIRRLVRALDDYLGIQRKLSPKRVEELQQYVNTVDATFPTAVILAISSEDVEYDNENGTLRIKDNDEVAKIIDGQHRIRGLEGYSGGIFQINVTIFVDMDIEDQAMVFATINLAQTKVNKSLVYDLFEYTKTRSPQKTSHNIARLLNSKEKSPFWGRIKILGTADPGKKVQTITQATFVEALIKLISGSDLKAQRDRDLLKRSSPLPKVSSEEKETLIFREMFLNERDAEIANAIWNYFDAIRERWPQSWNQVNIQGNILPRTNGFKAFMRLLPLIYSKLDLIGSKPSKKIFFGVLAQIMIEDGNFLSDIYKPGSSGETDLYTQLASSLD